MIINGGVFNAGRDLVAGVLFGGYSAIPTSYKVALLKSEPDQDADNAEILTLEPGGGYARVSVTNNGSNWAAPNGGLSTNVSTLYFPTATADWGLITHFAVLTNADIPMFYGSFLLPLYVTTGQTPRVDAGLLSFAVGAVESAIDA